MAIFLENSDGGSQSTPSEGQIAATLKRIGSSLDHCVLHLPGDAFVQTAGDASGLLLQYGDESGLYESDRSDFDVATVTRVFSEAASGGDGWKREITFRKTADAPGGAGAETGEESGVGGRSFRMLGGGVGTGGAAGGDTASGGSLKDQLLRQVKREISRGASRGVGNLIRKGIRGIIGRG